MLTVVDRATHGKATGYLSKRDMRAALKVGGAGGSRARAGGGGGDGQGTKLPVKAVQRAVLKVGAEDDPGLGRRPGALASNGLERWIQYWGACGAHAWAGAGGW